MRFSNIKVYDLLRWQVDYECLGEFNLAFTNSYEELDSFGDCNMNFPND